MAEIEETKMKIRQPINTDRQNLEDARDRLENLRTSNTGK